MQLLVIDLPDSYENSIGKLNQQPILISLKLTNLLIISSGYPGIRSEPRHKRIRTISGNDPSGSQANVIQSGARDQHRERHRPGRRSHDKTERSGQCQQIHDPDGEQGLSEYSEPDGADRQAVGSVYLL